MSEKYENPCTPDRCDVSHCCSKGTDAGSQTWEYWRTCTTFSLYLGHQEGYAAAAREIVEWLEGFGTTPRAGMTGAWLAELWRSEKGVM